VGVIPDPFSPNDDGVFDETTLYYTLSEAALVTVTVSGGAGIGPDTLRQAQESAGSHSLWWDGTSGGGTVPDGEYGFVIDVQPAMPPGQQVEVSFVVDTQPPSPGVYTVSPGRFSPDGDGVADSVLVSLSIASPEPTDETTVAVTETDGSAVRHLYSSTGEAQASFYWNGEDDEGTPVPDALYHVRFGIRDAAGNETLTSELVDLDTEPPWLEGDYPDPDVPEFRLADTTGVISGSATDRGGVVAVEFSFDQVTWYLADTVGADSVRWTASVPCDTCVPGVTDELFEVSVRAYDGTPTADGHGHVNGPSTVNPILEFDLIFDVAPPAHESSELMGDEGPFTPGQQIRISTRWDAAGYDVTGDFSDVVDTLLYDPDDVAVDDKPGGLYELSYTLPQGMPIPEGERAVVVTASDSLLTPTGPVERSVSDTTVYVTVVPASEEPRGLSVDVNSFDPTLGEVVTISFGAVQDRAKVSIFNIAGTAVRTLDEGGVSQLEWNGENEEGDTAASGVYLLWIQTDDGEATRKVAIVK
jgi:flagellar hook assembly protein FlgD